MLPSGAGIILYCVLVQWRDLRRATAPACRIECSPVERGQARWLFEKMIPCALVWISAAQKLSLSPSSATEDRKSTRLNSSHTVISYAVFCLKKKKTKRQRQGKHALR